MFVAPPSSKLRFGPLDRLGAALALALWVGAILAIALDALLST